MKVLVDASAISAYAHSDKLITAYVGVVSS